jgi:hypothetical protein
MNICTERGDKVPGIVDPESRWRTVILFSREETKFSHWIVNGAGPIVGVEGVPIKRLSLILPRIENWPSNPYCIL